MTSDPMNRSIPSTRASTPELTFAAGGPWWSCGLRLGVGVMRAPPPSRARPRRARPEPRRVAQPCDHVLAQPARARLAGEGGDDDLVDPLVVDGVHRGGVRVGVGDLAVRVDALRRAAPRARAAAGARPRGGRAVGGSLCGQISMKLAGGCFAARSLILASSASPSTVSFAITSTFASPPSRSGRRRRARPGGRPRPSRIRSTTSRRSQPDFCSGCVETMISSTGGSSCASASRTASTGSASTTKPSAAIPRRAGRSSVLSSRRRAAARRVSW